MLIQQDGHTITNLLCQEKYSKNLTIWYRICSGTGLNEETNRSLNLVYRISAPTVYIGCFNIFVERRLRAVGYKSYGIVRQT